MTLGPAVCVYLGAWAGLALLRALTIRRGWQWDWRPPRGRFKLAFTGWALVCEWWVPSGLNRSRSALLPTTARRRRKQSFDGGDGGGGGGGGGGEDSGGDGPTLAVLLFWLGQAAVVLFLAWNALVTLRDSGFSAGGAATKSEEHGRRLLLDAASVGVGGTLHVASRMRPMAFLLPSSAAAAAGGAGEATADWRFVWWATLLALAVHEYGHARAARREGIHVQHAGVYLAVLLPGAYVLIPDTIKDVSAWARLRVLIAGVAANAALCLLLALLLAAGLPARLLALPEPGGGAVIRSLSPDSPLGAALRPGDAIAALQDVPIVDGAAEMVSLLRTYAEVTAVRSSALLRAVAAAGAAAAGGGGDKEEQQQEEGGSFSLAALNATVAGLLVEARLSHLEAAGLLPPEAFCTHLDLTEGEDDEDRPVPSCCAFDALVGRSRPPQPASSSSSSVVTMSSTDTSSARTSCFAYLPLGDSEQERLHLTCLPARELALHSHVVGLGPVGSVAARGDRGRPFCFRPVSTPPNVLFKIALAHGRVVTFEGRVDDVANAQLAAGLADSRPRAWVQALLPERWAMALDAVLVKFCAALLDVSFSLGALNLVPLYQLDGAHALHEAALLLVRRLPPANGPGRHKLLTWYRGGVLAVGVVFAVNVLLAGLAAMEQGP